MILIVLLTVLALMVLALMVLVYGIGWTDGIREGRYQAWRNAPYVAEALRRVCSRLSKAARVEGGKP